MSLTPVVLLFIVAIILAFFKRLHKKKYKRSSLQLYPLLFPQEDEREKDITDRACRTTFVSLWFVLPCALGLLIFTPVANLYISAYPLYVMYLIYLIQMTVFHVSLYRNKLAKRNLLASARRFLFNYTCTYNNIILSFYIE